MTDNNEDYLDQLLNSVIEGEGQGKKGSTSGNGFDGGMSQQETSAETKESKRRRRQRDARKFFIDDFEKELEDFESGKDISDYELEMEQLLSDDAYGKNMVDNEPVPDSNQFFEGLNKAMNSEPPVEEETSSVIDAGSIPDAPVNEASADGGGDDLLSMFEAMQESEGASGEATQAAAGGVDVLAGAEAMPEMTDVIPEVGGSVEPAMEAAVDLAETAAAPDLTESVAVPAEEEYGPGDLTLENDAAGASGDENADDILSLLNGIGGDDEDLAGISDLLKADENKEPVATDGFEIDPHDAAELSGMKELSKEEKGVKDTEDKKKDKNGFFAKLKNLFFGPDEDEEETKAPDTGIKVSTAEDLEDMSDENLDILRALEGGGADASAPADDTKAKKKASKEEKKKAKKEQKELKKKEKEAKKKEKAAKKAAKPKKEKKPKVKDNTPPLPKLPVFLIFVMALSFGGAVVITGNALHSRMSMKNSEAAYEEGNYVDAYGAIAGMKFKKEKDIQYLEKVQILAGMQELMDSYETMRSCKREQLALDCLVRVVGHYDANLEKAEEGGYTEALTSFKKKAAGILKKQYKVRYKDAVAVYRIRSRKKYSIEIYRILKKVGIV